VIPLLRLLDEAQLLMEKEPAYIPPPADAAEQLDTEQLDT